MLKSYLEKEEDGLVLIINSKKKKKGWFIP